jgi:hypothetical protein
LDGITLTDIEKAKKAHVISDVIEEEYNIDKGWKEILEILEPKETLVKGIKRLGLVCATIPKWKKVKKVIVSEKERIEAKEKLDRLTFHASRILVKDPDVYDRTFEEIEFMLSGR